MLRPNILLSALSLIIQVIIAIGNGPCVPGLKLQSELMCATMAPASDFSVHLSETTVTPSETTVFSQETAVSLRETRMPRPETSLQHFDVTNVQMQMGIKRIFKRQTGRTFLGGCENYQLSRIMGHVVGSLTSNNRMMLGDVAKVLQQFVQRATGKSHEIIMGKGEMMVASHLMSEAGSCKMRIGDYYTTVYETPVQYNINNIQQEQILSNIDFGENLGGSGYPGQLPFPVRVYGPLAPEVQEPVSRDLVVETLDGPKRMGELKTGDEVMSVEEGMGMIIFSPIIMFLHRDEKRLAEFNVITLANGDSVKLTNDHLIQVFDCENADTLRLVRSMEVTTEHCLIAVRSPFRKISIGRVTNVTKVFEKGIFAPLTSTGDIIVNGVLSSCHSNLAFKTLQQSLFNGYRYLYRLFSFILPEEGSLPIGLTSLASTLDLFIPTKPIFI